MISNCPGAIRSQRQNTAETRTNALPVQVTIIDM
jgi:hypothetical protein